MKPCVLNKDRLKVIFSFSLFLLIYVVSFAFLEQREGPVALVMSKYDKLIPFCEYFIVPYVFWFLYLILMSVYFGFFCQNLQEVKRVASSFMLGMTVFLIISSLFPNGHTLRPNLTKDGFFVELVKQLYCIDTSTNVFPSMHVFCTIAASIALIRQNELTRIKGFKLIINLMTISIVLSTVFLKQHSIIDVFGAVLLNCICYVLFYQINIKLNKRKSKMIHQM